MDKAFARLYPKIIKSSEEKWLRERRARLLSEVAGDVVEIGAGTGLNLPHYGPDVMTLTLTEMSPHMIQTLEQEVASRRPEAKIVGAPAESLPLPGDSADVVVSTLVLCSVADQTKAIAEMRRVLRPGGRIYLLEHVAGAGRLHRIQRFADPITKTFGRGCHTSRDTKGAFAAAGFDTSGLRDEWIDSEPKIYAPHIVGSTTVA